MKRKNIFAQDYQTLRDNDFRPDDVDSEWELDARFIVCKSAAVCHRRSDTSYAPNGFRLRFRTPHRASRRSH